MKRDHLALRRGISILLCFVMLLGVLPTLALSGAAETPTGSNETFDIDEAKEYVLYSFHSDCENWFAAKADGSLQSLGNDLNIPAKTEGLRWTFELVSGNEYRVSNNGTYVSIASDKVVLSDKPASIWLIREGDGFYLSDESGTYVLNAGYTGGTHRLLAVKKTNSAARPFYIEETGDFYTESGALIALLPRENFKATIVPPARVTADTRVVIFAQGEDGNYYAINSIGKASSPLKVGTVAEDEIIKSPDADVLWSVLSRTGGTITADSGVVPFQRYFRSAVEDDGHYLVAGDEGILSAFNGDSNLNAVTNEDGLSFTLISDDDADGNNKCIVFKNGEFSVSDDAENATSFYFAKILSDELQDADVTAEIPEGTLLRLVDWADVKADGETQYALIIASEFNYLHHAVTGTGRYSQTGVVNLTDDWDGHEWETDSNARTTAICPFEIGDYLHTVSADVLWTVAERNGKYVFKNTGTGLYLSPDNGQNKEQTPAIAPTPARLTVETGNGNVIYLKNSKGNYLDFWKYIAVSSNGKNVVTNAFFIAELVSDGEQPTTDVPDGDEDEFFFGGAHSIYESSQHTLDDGGWWGVGAGAYVMMPAGSGAFSPDGSNFDITFCADYDADMPANIEELIKYTRVSIDDDAANDAQGKYSKDIRSMLKAMAPKAYPYVSVEKMLSAMEAAGFEVSEYCGPNEMLTGFQAAIYSITNPREDGELWSYYASDSAHNNNEVNRPGSYIADPEIAEHDVNTIRDYLLSMAGYSTTYALGEDDGREYFALTYDKGGVLYALGIHFSSVVGYRYAERNPNQWWYVDDKGYIRSAVGDMYIEMGIDTEISRNSQTGESSIWYQYAWVSLRSEDNLSTPWAGGSTYYPEVEEFFLMKWDGEKLFIDLDGYTLPENTDPDLQSFLRYDWYTYMSHNYNYDYMNVDFNEYNTAVELTQVNVPVPPTVKPYTLNDYNAKVTVNGNTYSVTITGTLNQPVQPDDTVKLWFYYDNAEGERVYADPVVLEAGDTQVNWTVSNIPADVEYTFAISYMMPFYDVYLYYPEDSEDGTPGWEVWQMQLGVENKSSYAEYFHNSTTLTVTKNWAEGEPKDIDAVTVDLVDKDGNVVDTIEVTKANGWKGTFAHVDYQQWTFETYTGDENNHPEDWSYRIGQSEQGRIDLDEQTYTVKEHDIYGFGSEVEGEGGDFTITNTPLPTGNLAVSKKVTGEYGDAEKEFKFKVTLTGKSNDWSLLGSEINGKYGDMTFVNGVAEFTLKSGVTVTATGLPAGLTYTVEEETADGYTPTATGATGTIAKDVTAKAEFTNDYHASSVEVTPEVKKELTGRDLEDGEFSFTMTVEGDGYELLGGTTATNDANGNVVFGGIRFNKTGTFTVTITEVNTQKPDVVYDTHSVVFTYEVKDDGRGNLYIEGGEPTVEGDTTFTNVQLNGLTVIKKVVGDDGDKEKEFTFTVTLDDKTVNGVYGEMEFTDGVATFTLKHDESKTAYGLPDGVGFEVKELLPAGDYSFMVTWTVDGVEVAKGWDVSATGVIEGVSKVEAIATNTRVELGGLIVTNVIDEKYEDVIDTEKEFVVTVDFFEGDLNGDGQYTDVDRGIASTINGVFVITRNDGTQETIEVVNGQAQIIMKHDESVVIDGLPAGLHYVVNEEKDAAGEYTGMDKKTGNVLTSDDSEGMSGTIPANDYAREDIVNVRLSTITISKTVTGEGGDKEFDFEFTLELDDKEINGVYGDLTFVDGVAHFTLRHGETKTVEGLAVGTGYTLTEKEYDDYEAVYTGRVGTVTEDGTKVSVENKVKEQAPETGDNSHLWLWMVLMIASAVGVLSVVLYSVRRRSMLDR